MKKYNINDMIICIGTSKIIKYLDKIPKRFIGQYGIIKEYEEDGVYEGLWNVYFKDLDDTIYLYEDEMMHPVEFLKDDEFKI